jgi:hypothetical protein
MPTTVSTDVSNTIYAKIIEELLVAYQYDEVTALPFFRYASLADRASATMGFPRRVKNAYAAVATETTSLSTTAYTTTNVDITVSRVGIAREVSETVLEDSILGRALYIQEFVADAARLYGEQLDTDATALFPTITASVGTTATDLSISTMVAGMSSQRVNKARGPQVVHLHDLQLKQLQQAQAAATATPWATFYTPNADSSAFGGYFMGAPVWASSKNPTANAAADRVGCIWSQGPSAPEFCSFAYVTKRMPSSLTESNILADSKRWASFARHGVGIVANNFATKIISRNL